jgi:hypothetical protein
MLQNPTPMPEQKAPMIVNTMHKLMTYRKQGAHSTRTEHLQVHGNEITHEPPLLIEWFSSIDPIIKNCFRFRFMTRLSMKVGFIS